MASADINEVVSNLSALNIEPNSDPSVEEIPPPKVPPVLKHLSVDYSKVTEVYFDLETTGLVKPIHITQLAAIRDGESFSRYIMPKIPISPGASKVTGISIKNGLMYHYENIVDTVSINVGLEQFCEFLGKSKNNVLVGHNIEKYDLPIILNAFKNCDKTEMFVKNVLGFLDTLKLFRSTHPGQKSYSQQSLVKNLTGKDYAAHDALEDVTALKDLLIGAGIKDESKKKISLTIQYALD